ncbi:SGNH hydrolase [Suhomyces tanzawaensis NRRL Y-17324]|uniref:SGNH hydrolase n=1 Tax=Suhomyces tanzawaensis NRRL Y-17324 TaxID=984487 RepID=A0A1E4SJ70_9ASCO|nr:SGNH hydrolase [Suhomyces tanzawaensis NRRL Y-17324]ODV79556.1 SGNH hydrolase [Suhomyces tanzawaensis NRRL Y-17324]
MSLAYDKFILFGDSITQFSNEPHIGYGFHPDLQNAYTRKLDVINRGYSGYNSRHAALVLPRVLEAELNQSKTNVKLMTIFIGTNDALEPNDSLGKIQRQSPEQYRQNLSQLVQLALANNIKPVVISPTLHDNKLSKELLEKDGRSSAVPLSSNRRNRVYADTAAEVAKEYDVAFVDLWNAFRDAGGFSDQQLLADEADLAEYLHDGIHFTKKAYDVLFQHVTKAIASRYPELSPENLPLQLAVWRNIDPENIEASIFK